MEQRQRRLYHECIIHDIDPKVMETIAVNFFINASLADWKRQEECREKYGCNIPWAILLDPTSACNLHCTGCWAAEYGNDASPELMPTPGTACGNLSPHSSVSCDETIVCNGFPE